MPDEFCLGWLTDACLSYLDSASASAYIFALPFGRPVRLSRFLPACVTLFVAAAKSVVVRGFDVLFNSLCMRVSYVRTYIVCLYAGVTAAALQGVCRPSTDSSSALPFPYSIQIQGCSQRAQRTTRAAGRQSSSFKREGRGPN